MTDFGSKQRKAIRAVALLESLKGILAIAAASGFVFLLHKDVADFALRLVRHAHLNPASHYPSIFIDAAAHLQNSRLLMIAVGAATYSLLRLIEAYGLYRERAWAEWLAAISGAIYVPFELLGLIHTPNLLHAALLLVNLAVVWLMVRALKERRQVD